MAAIVPHMVSETPPDGGRLTLREAVILVVTLAVVLAATIALVLSTTSTLS